MIPMAANGKGQDRGRLVTGALLALVAGLGYGVRGLSNYTPDTRPIRLPETLSATPVVRADDGASLLAVPRALADYQDTIKRPLFSADRRPVDRALPNVAEAAVQLVPAAPSPLEQFQLLGIVRDRGGPARALVRTGSDVPGVWIEVGDTVRGWKVSEISEQNAVLLANGVRGELRLFAARTAKPR